MTTTTIAYTDYFWPDSSFIDGAWYNDHTDSAYLSINGAIYQYDLPPEMWREFRTAPSKGSFYSTHIKGRLGSNIGDANTFDFQIEKPNSPVDKEQEFDISVNLSGVLSMRVPGESVLDAITMLADLMNVAMDGTWEIVKVEK